MIHKRRTSHRTSAWDWSWAIAILMVSAIGSRTACAKPVSQEPEWSHEHLDALLGPVFINKMAEYYVAGASVAVVKDGALTYARGFGFSDIFAQRRVEPWRSIFRIGSITKTLTGVALLQLVDRGLIDLEADVNNYLTEFKVGSEFAEPVRVKHLLTHTAGFDQLGFDRHALDASWTLPLGAFLARDLVRIRPPGVSSCYDTYGITLAGYLVEQVSGLTYAEYLHKNVFTPLEMKRSGIAVSPNLQDDHAIGYGFMGEWAPERWEYMNTDPASTVNSTAVDMSNYMIMLLGNGNFKGHQILSSEMAHAMLSRQHTNHPQLAGHSYTLWEDWKYGQRAFSHGGSMNGFGSILYLLPDEDLGVFIACNQESGRLEHAALTALIEHYYPERSETRKTSATLANVDTDRFVGTYANNMYNHSRPWLGGWWMRPVDVTATDRGEIVFAGEEARPVTPLTFELADGSVIVFSEDETGKIIEMLIEQRVYERVAPAAIDAYEAAKQPKGILVDDNVLRQYAGRYDSARGEIEIRPRAGGLDVKLPGLGTLRCLPYDERTYLVVDAPVRAVLRFDKQRPVKRAMLVVGEDVMELTSRSAL